MKPGLATLFLGLVDTRTGLADSDDEDGDVAGVVDGISSERCGWGFKRAGLSMGDKRVIDSLMGWSQLHQGAGHHFGQPDDGPQVVYERPAPQLRRAGLSQRRFRGSICPDFILRRT